MNIYLTGADGNVGRELMKFADVRPLQCDVTQLTSIVDALNGIHVDLIINLASISDPDYCEQEAHTEEIIKTNVRGAYNVALAAEQRNISVIFLSTDHIFDGMGGPYREDSKLTAPVNFYGQTKMSMEAVGNDFDNVKIVRTSTLFFPKRVLPVLPEYPTFLNRSFMYLPDFASSLFEYANRFQEMPKVLHLSGSEAISWYEFGLSLASVFKQDKEKISPRRKEIKNFSGAPRPYKAGLNVTLSKRLGFKQYSVLDGIKQMREEELCRELGY